MTEIVIYPALFATLAFVFWVLMNELHRRARLQSQDGFRAKLLDRATSAADIATLFDGPLGERLVHGFDMDVRNGIVRLVQIGVVLLFASGGLFVTISQASSDARSVLLVLAVMAGFVGLGCLFAAAASWRIALRLGLIAAHDPSLGRKD